MRDGEPFAPRGAKRRRLLGDVASSRDRSDAPAARLRSARRIAQLIERQGVVAVEQGGADRRSRKEGEKGDWRGSSLYRSRRRDKLAPAPAQAAVGKRSHEELMAAIRSIAVSCCANTRRAEALRRGSLGPQPTPRAKYVSARQKPSSLTFGGVQACLGAHRWSGIGNGSSRARSRGTAPLASSSSNSHCGRT